MIVILPQTTPVRCSDAGVDIVDRSCSGVLDCESDEQQMATQEWRSDASALRPSEVHNNSGVMIVKHLSTSLQLSLVTLH